ncbi:MAG: ubiquinone/menaquinone biosynthesis methyltransferase [Kiritimatiellae bacterium]|nr:ubiquinone/menaquinone biosynthesis methyltransferase [Kiritimatiellia bacterium]
MSQPLSSADALISAVENQRMFDAIVPRYDRLNALMSLGLHRRWRRQAVNRLDPVAHALYLDLGTGTGDLCVEILRQEPAARVLGIDPSTAMLEQARTKFTQLGVQDRAQVVSGDACNLDIEDAHVSGIVSGFCIRNLTDRNRAFHEMYRVTVPGGRIVLLELTRPSQPLLRAGHRLYSRLVVPLLGRALSRGDAYRYLTHSIEAFAEPAAIVTELRQAGFEDAAYRPLTGGVVALFSARRPAGMTDGIEA